MSSSAKGWLIGAAVTAALAFYTGWLNNIPGPIDDLGNGRYRSRYSCGAVWNPKYPRDGKGPCTEILADAQMLPMLWIAVTVVLLIVAFVKHSNEAKA